MPELPEVETIREGVARIVTGRTITGVDVMHPRAVRKSPAGLDPMVGCLISGVARRGKYLWIVTDGPALIAHLGMSGQFRVGGNGIDKHRRAAIHLDDGVRLDFVDQRTFGHLQPDELVATEDGEPGGHGTADALVPAAVAHIGRDLLDPACDLSAVASKVKTRRTEIKRALLDQQLASGIGNIYADEALFRSRVNGVRPTNRMSLAKITEVYRAARDVMAEALRVGGTSFDSLYVNVNGESGYFERALNVYGKAGSPCPRCHAIITKEPFMGRSSHYCPRCQARRR